MPITHSSTGLFLDNGNFTLSDVLEYDMQNLGLIATLPPAASIDMSSYKIRGYTPETFITVVLSGTAAGAGDVTTVIGVDMYGAAVSESIPTIADGTFTTTVRYAELISIDCTTYTGGTIAVYQDRVGLIDNALGPNLVFGGHFTSADDWTLGTDWSIAGGVATHVSGAQSDLLMDSTPPTVEGDLFLTYFEVTARTTGSTRIFINGGSGGTSHTSVGPHWELVTAGPAAASIKLQASATFDGSVDNFRVWKLSNQYTLHGNLQIAIDDPTTLTSLNELVYFDDGFEVTAIDEGELIWGAKVGSHGTQGSMWSFKPASTMPIIASGNSLAHFKMYASHLHDRGSGENITLVAGTVEILDSRYSSEGLTADDSNLNFITGIDSLNIDGLDIDTCESIGFGLVPDTANKIRAHNTFSGIKANSTVDVVATNPRVTDNADSDITTASTGVMDFQNTDPDSDALTPSNENAAGESDKSITCDIKAVSDNGTPLSGTSVVCTRSSLVVGSDANIYRNIQDIAVAVDATHMPITGSDWADYWELTSLTEGGVWVTGAAYNADEAVFNVSTAGDGTIAQQTLDYRVWDTDSEDLSMWAYKLALTNGGEVATLEDIDASKVLDWTVQVVPDDGSGTIRFGNNRFAGVNRF